MKARNPQWGAETYKGEWKGAWLGWGGLTKLHLSAQEGQSEGVICHRICMFAQGERRWAFQGQDAMWTKAWSFKRDFLSLSGEVWWWGQGLELRVWKRQVEVGPSRALGQSGHDFWAWMVSCPSRRVQIMFASLGRRVWRPRRGWPGGAGNGQDMSCTSALWGDDGVRGGAILVTVSRRGLRDLMTHWMWVWKESWATEMSRWGGGVGVTH